MSASILSFAGLTKRFGGLAAVDGVDLDIAQGDLVTIIGPNGAGKTTFFNLVTGQSAPTRGTVKFRGEDISRRSPEARARLGLGRTFQISRTLTSLTTIENALIGALLRERSVAVAARRAADVLDMVDLGHRADIRAGTLTLSERRRLEIARALALDCSVLLLDEVMAGLNQTEVAGVIELVQSLHRQGLTILVIEHNLKVVRALGNRVVVLNFGRKIAEGGPDEVLADPMVVEAYLGRKHA